MIKGSSNSEVLARHRLELGKGKLIKNRNHGRDRSKGIQAYKETVICQFKNTELATTYINDIMEEYPRYKRDQLAILQKATMDYAAFIDKALQKCMNDHLISANDFSDVAKYMSNTHGKEQPIQNSKSKRSKSRNIQVDTRPISTYTEILGGVM